MALPQRRPIGSPLLPSSPGHPLSGKPSGGYSTAPPLPNRIGYAGGGQQATAPQAGRTFDSTVAPPTQAESVAATRRGWTPQQQLEYAANVQRTTAAVGEEGGGPGRSQPGQHPFAGIAPAVPGKTPTGPSSGAPQASTPQSHLEAQQAASRANPGVTIGGNGYYGPPNSTAGLRPAGPNGMYGFHPPDPTSGRHTYGGSASGGAGGVGNTFGLDPSTLARLSGQDFAKLQQRAGNANALGIDPAELAQMSHADYSRLTNRTGLSPGGSQGMQQGAGGFGGENSFNLPIPFGRPTDSPVSGAGMPMSGGGITPQAPYPTGFGSEGSSGNNRMMSLADFGRQGVQATVHNPAEQMYHDNPMLKQLSTPGDLKANMGLGDRFQKLAQQRNLQNLNVSLSTQPIEAQLARTTMGAQSGLGQAELSRRMTALRDQYGLARMGQGLTAARGIYNG